MAHAPSRRPQAIPHTPWPIGHMPLAMVHQSHATGRRPKYRDDQARRLDPRGSCPRAGGQRPEARDQRLKVKGQRQAVRGQRPCCALAGPLAARCQPLATAHAGHWTRATGHGLQVRACMRACAWRKHACGRTSLARVNASMHARTHAHAMYLSRSCRSCMCVCKRVCGYRFAKRSAAGQSRRPSESDRDGPAGTGSIPFDATDPS